MKLFYLYFLLGVGSLFTATAVTENLDRPSSVWIVSTGLILFILFGVLAARVLRKFDIQQPRRH